MKRLRSPEVALAALAALGLVLSAQGSGQDREALSASDAVGHVLDREGGAARRGVLAARWSPVEAGTELTVGDWLELPSRGANALRVRLAGGAELTLGPGTLLEVAAGDRIALARGEVEVELPDGVTAPVDVTGPADTTIRVERRAVLRANARELVRLEEDPRWLVGYEADASTEALGSLLANVDGRNVPLTIGYHKVTVDIRDQIARTVIEESFVNHTHTVLEGVFYFPLPAGASISSFGMWIGNELVQGDIVEKQRAREIYETILRERRDPGLLEWTGGNIFKARVFPIGSEKRIRIAYTQVLPRQGNTFAYHYALQSELLRQTPLQRLEIEVNVSSTQALAGVDCPSHTTRIRSTEHAAKVEFAAEEFAPERDFELRVQLQPGADAITVVPHRRGDDGYFMLLVDAPPTLGAGSEQATEPIELLVLADTSGSMWGPPRANQVAFIESLIAALGPQDTFRLATCDVETHFAFERPVASTLENRERALAFLEQRDPLGWSDLKGAFAAAREHAGANTHVVYVGDGVPTSGAVNPIELAHELRDPSFQRGTFHAVVPGPSSEMAVLRALAGIGGGSVRSIGGGTDPTQTAFDLLKEITSPAIKDLEVHFEGLAVAAIYPETLPNLPAGGQQIVVGRFDPTGGDLAGRVRVTGTLDGEPIAFERELTLLADDEGNSFVPRLWARRYLDQLLDQGASERVKERIIALSEDYQIVTPYTSFLVLESDEDRERFGVEARFRMRDGEEFFAEGRDDARHQLLREQMLAARSWRQGLRTELLRSLKGLGRDLTELLRGTGPVYGRTAAFGSLGLKSEDRYAGTSLDTLRFDIDLAQDDDNGFGDELGESEGLDTKGDLLDEELWDVVEEPALEQNVAARERVAMKSTASGADGFFLGRGAARGPMSPGPGYAGGLLGGGRSGPRPPHDPFDSLFPALAGPRADDPESTWPADVLAALARIDRRRALATTPQAWRIGVDTTWTDAHGRQSSSSGAWLLGPDRWVTLAPHAPGQLYAVDWWLDGRRGTLQEGWRLGRERAAEDADADAWSAPFSWYFGDVVRQYAGYQARLVELDGERVQVVLWQALTPEHTITLEIDTERDLLLEYTYAVKGERASGQRFDDFHELGGLWWPGSIQPWARDPQGESVTRIAVEAPGAEEFALLVEAELLRRDDSILLKDEAPQLAAAKQAVQDGTAGFAERWVLLRHFAGTQRWDRAEPHLAALFELAAGKPGLVPIRLVWLQQSRGQEQLRQELLRFAGELVAEARDAEYGLALQVLGYAQGMNQGNEVLQLLETIHPVFLRQPALIDAELPWDQRRLQALQNLNRPEVLFAERRHAALKWPYDVNMQVAYAILLAQRGEVDEALAWLVTAEAEHGPWQDYYRRSLRQATLQILWGGYRLEQLVATFEDWERADPALLDMGSANQYLSALIFLDREPEAWTRIEAWLALAAEDELESTEAAFLQAAIAHTLGQGHQLQHQRLDDERLELLAVTARRLAHGDDDYQAGRILQQWTFRSSDVGIALHAELFAELQEGVLEFDAQRLARWIPWLRSAGSTTGIEEDAWQALLERVFERWLATEDEAELASLGQTVLNYGASDLRLRYLRQALVRADGEEERIAAATQLYMELLQQQWSPEVERELVALFAPLTSTTADPDELSENVDRRVLALYELVNWIQRARTEALVTALPEYETLTRRALASERKQALRTARAGAAALMAELESSFTTPELKAWATLERLYLDVREKQDLDEAWTQSLALLSGEVEALIAATDPEAVALRARILSRRCIATCTFLLLSADGAELDERVAALRAQLDRLIALDQATDSLPDGRTATRNLLIALDRGDELEAVLSSWFGGGEEFVKLRWGSDYAHVLAERGQIREAAEVLEEIERIDELTEADLRVLSNWYTALDQQDRARGALLRSFEVLGEYQLADDLYRRLNTYQRYGDDIPPGLDPEIPLRFVALMRKATQPQNRFWVLNQYYAATKDFRLLECLPDAVLGHSAQNIYPFLTQLGDLAALIDEEATVDRIQTQLAGLRETAETDVDRRALSLLQFQILLKAARQSHGTARHAARSLSALREAFQGEWVEGELGLMAEFLVRQGRLEPAALAEEQLRQVRALRNLATDPDERYAIGLGLARTLWAYGDQDQAVQTLEGALTERRSAGGHLPPSANDGLQTLSSWLVSLQSFRRAEALWLAELDADQEQSQVLWLRERLFEVYRDTLLMRGELSLGRGEVLYAAVLEAILLDLSEWTNEAHARQVVGLLTDLWQRTQRELRFARVGDDLNDFAFGKLPEVLDLYQYRNGQPMVSDVAECLRQVRGPLPALEFLVVRAETEPSWLRLQNQDFWRQHSYMLGKTLHEASAVQASLEQRVLRIVLTELRADLGSRQQQNRNIYDDRRSYFWEAKREDFLRAAQRFVQEHGDSPRSIAYAAEYLYMGLSAPDEAIDALFGPYRRGSLHLEGRDQLATYLQERKRWTESIPLVVELVAERPAEARYRVMLMLGYFHVGEAGALARTLTEAEGWFRGEELWTESVIATLANGCLVTQLFEDCARLYGEAIALRVRSSPDRGVGDGVLCTYYRFQSGAYSGLGRTDEAVDAAAGAIVSWGRDLGQRASELANLVGVLERAPDLEAYVARLDAEVEATGLENPILRKALGQLYLNREQYPAAVEQLTLAIRAAPEDPENQQLLLTAYDRQQQPELAAEALLAWSRTSGRELGHYVDLGSRYLALELTDRSERAFTNLVELSAQESEGHQLLAEVRERQGRWEEAAERWRHVTRIRTNEPTAYVQLARALIRLERLDEAREVAAHLRATSWPTRFGDMNGTADELLREIESRG